MGEPEEKMKIQKLEKELTEKTHKFLQLKWPVR